MSNTTEVTVSPRLRAMFVIGAAIMLALWGWSLVPPIENWGNPNEDGFSYVAVFYTTIICLPVGIYLLVGAITGHGRYVRRARTAFFIAVGITLLEAWSVQPCVRPVDAVHITAGHNALRGSGPGQKLAFDNALAQMGCPDRRIDRLCITCCSPSQPSHHIGCPMRSRSRRERGGFFVAFAPSHHRPRHPGDLVGERDGRDLRRSPRQ